MECLFNGAVFVGPMRRLIASVIFGIFLLSSVATGGDTTTVDTKGVLVMLGEPVSWHTRHLETPVERKARYATIDEAVDSVSGEGPKYWTRLMRKAAVLAVMRMESAFDPIVHAGGVHPVWTQDHGHSRCMGQIHDTVVKDRQRWEQLAGTDLEATTRCAREIIHQLTVVSWCGRPRKGDNGSDSWIRVFSAYGSGMGCAPTKAGEAKANAFSRFLVRMR